MSDQRGKLIAAMGIPGCGKSSVFTELGLLNDWKVFNEPEEEDWPAAVQQRETCGKFTAISWFRSMRVPDLFAAHELRESGATVLVDSYYDRLVGYYLGIEGMEWLIERDDPYYALTEEMARLDREFLPDADIIIMFVVARDTWIEFLRQRGRELDKDAAFLQSFRSQQPFIDACEAYCRGTGAELIRFDQTISSPKEAALKLAGLISRSVVP